MGSHSTLACLQHQALLRLIFILSIQSTKFLFRVLLFIHAQFFFFFFILLSTIQQFLFHSISLCVNWNQFSVSCTGAKNRLQSIWHSNDMFTNTSSVCFIYSFLHLVRFSSVVSVWNSTYKTWKCFGIFVVALISSWECERFTSSRWIAERRGVFLRAGFVAKMYNDLQQWLRQKW